MTSLDFNAPAWVMCSGCSGVEKTTVGLVQDRQKEVEAVHELRHKMTNIVSWTSTQQITEEYLKIFGYREKKL